MFFEEVGNMTELHIDDRAYMKKEQARLARGRLEVSKLSIPLVSDTKWIAREIAGKPLTFIVLKGDVAATRLLQVLAGMIELCAHEKLTYDNVEHLARAIEVGRLTPARSVPLVTHDMPCKRGHFTLAGARRGSFASLPLRRDAWISDPALPFTWHQAVLLSNANLPLKGDTKLLHKRIEGIAYQIRSWVVKGPRLP